MGRGFYYCTTIFNWVLLLIADALPFASLWPFGRPISGFSSWGLVVVDGSTAFRLPGGGSLSVAPERNQRAPQGLCPWESHQGVPPGSPKGWGKRPIPSYPCGAIGRSLRGESPLRLCLRGRRPAAEVWAHATSPKGSIFSAEKITEYGQLSVGRKRPDGHKWEQKAKMPLLPPPPEPIPRGRTRNRSAETDGDRTAQDKQGGGLDCKP